MTFTNQIEKSDKNTCYYRKAFSPEIFEKLSLEEKRSLIAFTVGEFSNDVDVAYSDELCNEIGILLEQDILLVNNAMLFKSKKKYSLELYLFLYNVLTKRFVARKKFFVPVIEECYINEKWRKNDYRNYTMDFIILHLLLDELLEMNEVVLIKDEDRSFFLKVIEDISNHISQLHNIVETVYIEIPQEQTSINEAYNFHSDRKR